MNDSPRLLVLLPSLRISGGVAETLKLARELQSGGVRIQVISFWKHAHELDTDGLAVEHMIDEPPQRSQALLQLPLIAWRFVRFAMRWRRREQGKAWLLLTHFTTFFLAWLLPGVPRICFNQDQEWFFVRNGLQRKGLKQVILFTSKRSIVLTTNSYISDQFKSQGVSVFGEASIWADPQWLADEVSIDRPITVTMLCRLSPFKRLDLHLELLRQLKLEPSVLVTVVTPEDEIANQVSCLADDVLLRPSNEKLKEIFGATKFFVLLSDVEGFGLPPLEAMGSGAIPICRDSGGVRNYMQGTFTSLLIPKTESITITRNRIRDLLASPACPTPEQARTAFQDGLVESRRRREETIHRLSSLLHTGKID